MQRLHILEKLGLDSASFPSQWAHLTPVICAARAGGSSRMQGPIVCVKRARGRLSFVRKHDIKI